MDGYTYLRYLVALGHLPSYPCRTWILLVVLTFEIEFVGSYFCTCFLNLGLINGIYTYTSLFSDLAVFEIRFQFLEESLT